MNTKLPTLFSLLLLALSAGPASSGEHPDTLVNGDSGAGTLEWRAASLVLHEDGPVRSSVSEPIRRRLENKMFCSGRPLLVVDYRAPEIYGGDFDTTLLLTEVAVLATISDFIPGFVGGTPYKLAALSDVQPLHGGSSSPAYLLIPVPRIEINGQAFCGDPQHEGLAPKLQAGDRIVLIGRQSQGAVWIGHTLSYDLALVADEEGSLAWGRRGRTDSPPKTLPLLQERVDEAVDGRLLEMTAPLRLEDSYSPARREFSEAWWRHHQDGCRIRTAEKLSSHSWQLTQTCGREERVLVP